MSFPRRRSAVLAVAAVLAAAPSAAQAAPDPLLPDQWSLADPSPIGIAEAWTQSTGGGVVVAVVDTGVRLDHPDLRDNLWRNPNEVAGNGIDDDRNGFVDDMHGADVLSGGGVPNDDEGHGTHVAGIIAARAGNGVGGSGVAPDARIMAVKALDARRTGTISSLAAGIRYAVRNGADVINASINGDDASASLREAIAEAGRAGVTIVASAGNDRRDIDLLPSYPAALPDDHLLAVTATDDDGLLWSLANRGANAVDLAAPGAHILSTARDGGYEYRSGTSMAAPHVAGALALLTAARPDLAPGELRDALLSTSRRASGLSGLLATGSLDVAAAMHRVRPGELWKVTASSVAPKLRLKAAKRIRSGRSTVRWSRNGFSTVARWRVSLDGRVVARLGANRALRVRRTVRPGSHRWRVVGFDAQGEKVTAAIVRFRAVRARFRP